MSNTSFDSFQGYSVTCALGANSTRSIAASYEWEGVSSGMTSNGVWHDRREVPRHAVHEVRLNAVKVVQVRLDRFHSDVGATGTENGGPNISAGVVHGVRRFSCVPNGLTENGGSDSVRRPFYELESKWPPMQ